MSFRLEEYIGSQWEIIGTYDTRKSPDSIYTIPVLRNSVAKLRIANNTGSGLYIYKILTRTYQEATEMTLRTTSPTEGEVAFANLKKFITLTYNKNAEKVSGTILLNGVEIPLSTCTITDNVISIPVTLENIPGSNKNYTLTVSAGAFAEAGNSSNLSKAITVNFQTLKSVVYPTNYNALLDVVYKDVNSTNTRMDIYYPTDATTPVPVVINMHGGGWSGGFKEEQGGFNMYFNKGYAVANVEYRLRGEALAPACVEDVRGALNYILNHAGDLNIDVNKVIFQGGSAGGHIALMGGYLQNNKIYDNDCVQFANPIKIMAVIDKYGPCDFTQLMTYSSLISWTGSRFSDQAFLNSLSPIEYVDANTPPTYIIHGDADPTIPYNQSVTLYAALQSAGVKCKFTTVPNGGHGGFPDAYNTQMETEIGVFLSEVLATQSTAVKSTLADNGINLEITGNKVSVISKEKVDIRIYNSLGKEILSTQNKNFMIPQKGLYIIKVRTLNGEFSSKFIIK
jgi:acetyl esterase/lipase